MPLDIMLPFWGSPSYLRETVESVRRQTSGDWLLTVVDDAYPDESVAEYFAGIDDERITYVRKDVNEGITANYQTCVGLATQEYMMLLGCDDVLHPTFVATVTEALARFPVADIVQPGVVVIDEDGQPVSTLVDTVKRSLMMPRASTPRIVSGEQLAASLLRADWMYWPSLVFRRERLAATQFRDNFPLIQDLAVVIDMVAAGASMLIEPTVCFAYRRHSQSASSATLLNGARFEGERRYFALAADLMGELGWSRARREAQLHLTSRLHAVALLPQTVRSSDGSATDMLRHAFTPSV